MMGYGRTLLEVIGIGLLAAMMAVYLLLALPIILLGALIAWAHSHDVRRA
jgi:hypothetical protein